MAKAQRESVLPIGVTNRIDYLVSGRLQKAAEPVRQERLLARRESAAKELAKKTEQAGTLAECIIEIDADSKVAEFLGHEYVLNYFKNRNQPGLVVYVAVGSSDYSPQPHNGLYVNAHGLVRVWCGQRQSIGTTRDLVHAILEDKRQDMTPESIRHSVADEIKKVVKEIESDYRLDSLKER